VAANALDDIDGIGVADLVIDGSPVASSAKQAVGAHEIEVLTAGGRGQIEGLGQFSDGMASAVEQLDDFQPVRVGEDAEGGGDALESLYGNGAGRS